MEGSDGPQAAVLGEEHLKPFLASAIFVLPWISWQAWVLGSSFRQRRGELNLEASEQETPSDGQDAAGAAGAAAPGPSGAATTSKAAAPTNPETAPAETATTPKDAPQDRWRSAIFVIGVTSLFMTAQAWLSRVLTTVPEPYLDEIFHIPQAQRYCQDKWSEWDDKITTPPGLYLFSYLYKGFWSEIEGCSVWALRGANTIAIVLVSIVACTCRSEIEHQVQYYLQLVLDKKEAKEKGLDTKKHHIPTLKLVDNVFSLSTFQTSLNVALFPVLFFFSALYYTDVYSTLVVLIVYRNHLFRRDYREVEDKADKPQPPPEWNSTLTIGLGIFALVMRQTNIFWVVVYMGGLEAVAAVKSVRHQNQDKLKAVSTQKFDSLADMVRHYAWRYSLGDIHDPPVGQSWPDDWLLSLVSIAIAVVSNPGTVFVYVLPYVIVLGSFVGFVVWNGGVVLGDKSNHVATLHLAQMLYIWPLFAFFSAPLFVSHGFYYLKKLAGGKTTKAEETKADDDESSLSKVLQLVFVKKAYYPVYLLVVGLLLPLGIVHFNTIIHPFTLADNRHYMFYVFRYSIRRASWIKYALVPVYSVCAWACWRVLWGGDKAEGSGGVSPSLPPEAVFINSPFVTSPQIVEEEEEEVPPVDKKSKQRQSKQKRPPKNSKKAKKVTIETPAEEEEPVVYSLMPKNAIFLSFLNEDPAGAAAKAEPTTSTALLWLLATTLSLMTAPLVEPRYFILPWVFWRLLVPAWGDQAEKETSEKETSKETPESKSESTGSETTPRLDYRFILETLWFAAINAATMYVFLYKPYVWRSEDGTVLDGGRLQRFMW